MAVRSSGAQGGGIASGSKHSEAFPPDDVARPGSTTCEATHPSSPVSLCQAAKQQGDIVYMLAFTPPFRFSATLEVRHRLLAHLLLARSNPQPDSLSPALLQAHESDVRSVVAPYSDLIVTASRDETVCSWTRAGPAEKEVRSPLQSLPPSAYIPLPTQLFDFNTRTCKIDGDTLFLQFRLSSVGLGHHAYVNSVAFVYPHGDNPNGASVPLPIFCHRSQEELTRAFLDQV